MALLIGEFEQVIDPAKHRLAINSAFREAMSPEEDGQDWILVLGPDRHLWLYPDLYFRKLLAAMKRSPLPDRNASKINLLFAMARNLKPDAQGRVVVPEKSMERAVISEKVTLVGANDHIEIWPTDEWEKHVQEQLPHYGELLYDAAERLSLEQNAQPPKV